MFGLIVLLSAGTEPFLAGAPSSRTGAPGDIGTCTACHGPFPENSGNGSVSIDAPAEYEPGQVVELTVTVADPDALNFGFEITAKDDTATIVGTWELVDTNTKFTAGSSNYVTHQTAQLVTGSQTYTLRWIAPQIDVGTVHFYAAGNGGNMNFSPQGDRIYTTNRTIMPANPTTLESEMMPSAFRVTDVFPNPFVEHTTLSFDLPMASNVSMSVFDMSGRQLLTSSLGWYGAGRHQATLSAENLPAGVLVYRLRANSGLSTGRVVLIR